jgi:hypothetical protein
MLKHNQLLLPRQPLLFMVFYPILVPVLQLLFGLNTKKKVMKFGKRQIKKLELALN